MKLQGRVDPGVWLLERIAYTEHSWIDVLIAHDGLHIQLITVIANGLWFLLRIHGSS